MIGKEKLQPESRENEKKFQDFYIYKIRIIFCKNYFFPKEIYHWYHNLRHTNQYLQKLLMLSYQVLLPSPIYYTYFMLKRLLRNIRTSPMADVIIELYIKAESQWDVMSPFSSFCKIGPKSLTILGIVQLKWVLVISTTLGVTSRFALKISLTGLMCFVHNPCRVQL